MRVLVTGSSGHLGEALVRTLRDQGRDVVGIDILPSPFTTHTGSIVDRGFVKQCMRGVSTVFHAATLHKPHIATHRRQAFIDVNITGTLNLLEEAGGVKAFIYTSTTSVFGDALTPGAGAPAAWITEEVTPIPKNIYGVTKAAAENLCQIANRNDGLPCLVLRTSRFFPEPDDDPAVLAAMSADNVKANEFLHRRVDIEDVVSAHLLGAERAAEIGFGRYIISATTPIEKADAGLLRTDAATVVRRHVPEHETVYVQRGWRLPTVLDRVYDNSRAREKLGWRPRHDFRSLVLRLASGGPLMSPLAAAIGAKGYHATARA